MGKFTKEERIIVKAIVATLSIKRIPDNEIINEIYRQTNKRIGTKAIYELKQSIKKDSYHWYKTMREGQYQYIHEFKERINEILDLQRRHHAIRRELAESLSTTIRKTVSMLFYIIVGVLVALVGIQTDTVFGQANQTTANLSTIECVPYSGTHLVIVVIDYKENPEFNCQEELNGQIALFHPTGISVSTLEVADSKYLPPHRQDVVYLIK